MKKEQQRNEPPREVGAVGRIFIVLLFIAAIMGMFLVNAQIKGGFEWYMGMFGSLMITYLLGKMALSFFYRPKDSKNVPDVTISAVVPFYNESYQAIKATLDSLLAQDYPIQEIFLVDDGSKGNDRDMERLGRYIHNLDTATNIVLHSLPKNRGKRHAQVWAFERVTGDIIVTVDSDVYLYPNAIRELITPFADKEVMATTGHVAARNRNDNFFAKLIDMRYHNAFRVERSAQSVTGNILVCSGCFSAYRKEVIMGNLDHYQNQTFLGEPVQFGDDRCLTNYAILKGKTLYQSTAHCETDVPSSLKQFLKQQVRWNKSFFRESLIAFTIGFKKPKVLVWAIFEMLLWILFGITLIVGLLFKSKTLGMMIFIYYLAYVALSAYARNVFYILKHPLIFFAAPIYGLIHLTILVPLRVYALATIKNNGWGTR